jgi:hypothetical protein
MTCNEEVSNIVICVCSHQSHAITIVMQFQYVHWQIITLCVIGLEFSDNCTLNLLQLKPNQSLERPVPTGWLAAIRPAWTS